MMRHRVCYVLPEYQEDASTHFSYIGGLLKEASRELDIFLIILSGEKPKDDFGCTRVVLCNGNFIVRNAKLKLWALYARTHGYRDFYVHYSFLSAFILSFFFGRVFYWNCGEPWKFSRSFVREQFERLTYRTITHLVTGAEILADEYAKHYPISRKKIKVMPNWVDMERFADVSNREELKKELGLPTDKKIIFFVHRLSSRKGAQMILPVASEVVQKRNDVLFVVAGKGPDEKTLHERSEKSDVLRGKVRFVGAVPNRDIQKYFAVADVFFMPSQEEGFPRALLESMAAGVPSVSSNVGAVSELVPSSFKKYVFDPNDTDGFADGIHELLSLSLEKTEEMRKDLRSHASDFTTEKVAKKFATLFV